MKDFELINEKFDKKLIMSMTKAQFKKWIKNKIKKAALIFLTQENSEKSKTKNIIYKELKLQNYLKSKLFSNYEVEYLFKLRSQTTDLKSNFKFQYKNNVECSMNECKSDETQHHIFLCKNLRKFLTKDEKRIKYQDIYEGVARQYKATALFIKLMNRRSKMTK